jgi:hypothetical protein
MGWPKAPFFSGVLGNVLIGDRLVVRPRILHGNKFHRQIKTGRFPEMGI